MEIIYRTHAVERMIERNISTRDIELILTAPDGKIKQSNDKFIFYKNIGSRKDNMVAAVTVIVARKKYEIITVLINFEVTV